MKLLDLSEGYLRFPPVKIRALDNLKINGFIFLQNAAVYHIQRGGSRIHRWWEWMNARGGGGGRLCTSLSRVRSAILELVVVGRLCFEIHHNLLRAPTVI